MPKELSSMTHPAYRADIDGLRAIAVLAVVLYHAFPEKLDGGFIGVDIFFVISGYLISSIILSNLDNNSFSIVDFYRRRIRRIFPALLLMMLACLTLGWFVLLADEYKQLGKHITSGAGFVANLVLWGESSYFDNASETKPLLHLWSLGIEEQFYIIWPLLLALAWKWHRNLLYITIAIAIMSFATGIFLLDQNRPDAAFYSPASRFWELMTGGILAFITLHKPGWLLTYKNTRAIAGLIMLLAGLTLINKFLAFPGWWALLPTLGTCLIISAGPATWINSRLLASKPLTGIGLISYPLYLWHWPLLSFATIIQGDIDSKTRWILVLLSIALAWFTYQFIEKPVRAGKLGTRTVTILGISMIATAMAGYYCYQSNGFNGYGFRSADKQVYADFFANTSPTLNNFNTLYPDSITRPECNFYALKKYRSIRHHFDEIDKTCYVRDNALDKAIFIWGDSHAQNLHYGLKKNLPANWQILQIASSSCPPILDSQPSETNHCLQSNWFALETIKTIRPDVVILAQMSKHNVSDMLAISSALTTMGVGKVIFVGPTPNWTIYLPKLIMRKLWDNTPQRTHIGRDERHFILNEKIKKGLGNHKEIHYASTIDAFCNQDGCLTYIGDDKMTGITTTDYGHLSPAASVYLAKNLLIPMITGNIQ